MDMSRTSITTLSIGEYQLMQEELDRNSIPMTFGFGKSIHGQKDVPTLVLLVPLENKEKYNNADIESGWGLFHNENGIESIYMELKFKDVKTIRVRFDKTMIGDMFLDWLELLIQTDGFLMLNDTEKLGEVEGLGVSGIALDIPKLIVQKIKEAKALAANFATTLAYTNGICPICVQRVYERNNDNQTISIDIERGINHFLAHDARDQQAYQQKCKFLHL
ncbi:MAG: hypothetical protein PHW62_00385 [Candidatus Ratteibacteria bacterium]|nr:hypothetical protein [Candidatus Ratteibacteria bacterium]